MVSLVTERCKNAVIVYREGFQRATQLHRQELIGELRKEEGHSGEKEQEQRHKVSLK